MSTTPAPQPSKGAVIFENVLSDLLLLGSLAATIFVKNPAHQTEAGNLISAVAQVLQVIDGQINAASTPPATPPAA